MTPDDIRPWVSLVWAVAEPTIATGLAGLLAALIVKARAWIDTRLLGQKIDNATQDQAKMETELQAALGKGFDAAAQAINTQGLTSDAARVAILTAATTYFQQRFPDRTAQIDAATPPSVSPAAAVAETLAARLGNIVAATAQQAAAQPATQGNPP